MGNQIFYWLLPSMHLRILFAWTIGSIRLRTREAGFDRSWPCKSWTSKLSQTSADGALLEVISNKPAGSWVTWPRAWAGKDPLPLCMEKGQSVMLLRRRGMTQENRHAWVSNLLVTNNFPTLDLTSWRDAASNTSTDLWSDMPLCSTLIPGSWICPYGTSSSKVSMLCFLSSSIPVLWWKL